MSRKKHKHAEHVNMERWLVSYADFITLLFILFLILFAMSTVSIAKFEALKQSMIDQKGMGGSIIFENPGSSPKQVDSIDGTGKEKDQGKNKDSKLSEKEKEKEREKEKEKMEQLKKEILKYAQQEKIAQFLHITVDAEGLNIIITGSVLYENGKANLSVEAKKRIQHIFDIIVKMGVQNPLQIEGHTDNRPIHTSEFPSNWELSSARSVNLLRYLIEEYNYDPKKISASAYGEYHPIASNQTEAGREKNRRVEIKILNMKK